MLILTIVERALKFINTIHPPPRRESEGMIPPKRPEKKSRNYICGDTYGNGFNECHDRDTAYLTELLKEVREIKKKFPMSEMLEGERSWIIIKAIKDLIERVDHENK